MSEHFIATYQHTNGDLKKCLKIAKEHARRFDRFVTAAGLNHYSTGKHIDAYTNMRAEYAVMVAIERWCYSNVPATAYDRICRAMGFKPQSHFNRRD